MSKLTTLREAIKGMTEKQACVIATKLYELLLKAFLKSDTSKSTTHS
jgi:hypothetical protein